MEHINELITESADKMSALEELYYLVKNDVFAFAYLFFMECQSLWND